MPVDVYLAAASPPCRAVLMTAKYLGIDLNEKLMNLSRGDAKTPEFTKINPQQTIPTIDDNGFVLWESRAVQTYLANKFAPNNPLYPQDPQERAVVDRMLYFDVGTLYKAETEYVFPQIFQGEPADSEKEEAFKKGLTLLEGFLSTTPYVAGNHITLADLSIIASLTFTQIIDYNFDSYPRIVAWMDRMRAEVPGFKEINDDPLEKYKEFINSK